MHARGRAGSSKAAIVGDSLQLTSEEQQELEQVKYEFGDVVTNSVPPAGRSSAWRQMHRIELVPVAAPSFVPRYWKPPNRGGKVRNKRTNS